MNVTKYHRVFKLLKDNGHSALSALEIIFDAKRGDRRATYWIRILHG